MFRRVNRCFHFSEKETIDLANGFFMYSSYVPQRGAPNEGAFGNKYRIRDLDLSVCLCVWVREWLSGVCRNWNLCRCSMTFCIRRKVSEHRWLYFFLFFSLVVLCGWCGWRSFFCSYEGFFLGIS